MARDEMKEEEEDQAPMVSLDAEDIAILRSYGRGPYGSSIEAAESRVKELMKEINIAAGVTEEDTGLAPPAEWDVPADKQTLARTQGLYVSKVTKIIPGEEETDPTKYLINLRQHARYEDVHMYNTHVHV
ncbi:hypothetical protein KIPB_013682 [Kipferlia bialata]|uniref:Uncharacterized protein n=1 Tax=Kipferlia bialata TaxID=797122 RepID=A0A391NSJ7_9EUKA|nr:hypothetical protein KIPB_013682 [Kipferlia bialata]|eukprot:g13682.t1